MITASLNVLKGFPLGQPRASRWKRDGLSVNLGGCFRRIFTFHVVNLLILFLIVDADTNELQYDLGKWACKPPATTAFADRKKMGKILWDGPRFAASRVSAVATRATDCTGTGILHARAGDIACVKCSYAEDTQNL